MEYIIKLTAEERKNLITFLQRTQLTGAEVPEYVKIADAINKSILEQEKSKE